MSVTSPKEIGQPSMMSIWRGGSEAEGGDIMLADKVFVYEGYSSSTAIHEGMGSDCHYIK